MRRSCVATPARCRAACRPPPLERTCPRTESVAPPETRPGFSCRPPRRRRGAAPRYPSAGYVEGGRAIIVPHRRKFTRGERVILGSSHMLSIWTTAPLSTPAYKGRVSQNVLLGCWCVERGGEARTAHVNSKVRAGEETRGRDPRMGKCQWPLRGDQGFLEREGGKSTLSTAERRHSCDLATRGRVKGTGGQLQATESEAALKPHRPHSHGGHPLRARNPYFLLKRLGIESRWGGTLMVGLGREGETPACFSTSGADRISNTDR